MIRGRIYLILTGILLSFAAFPQNVLVNDTIVCQVKVKLVKAERLPPHCGVIAQALAQQFEIIESSFEVLKPTYKVLLIQPCPELLGHDFFLTGQIYTATISTVNDTQTDYLVNNATGKANLLTFWIRKIKAPPVMNFKTGRDNLL
jgi:hypothetical protein